MYKPATTNDYSLYVDAVNTDLNGNAVSSGVRLGFYNLSTSTASNLAKQQLLRDSVIQASMVLMSIFILTYDSDWHTIKDQALSVIYLRILQLLMPMLDVAIH